MEIHESNKLRIHRSGSVYRSMAAVRERVVQCCHRSGVHFAADGEEQICLQAEHGVDDVGGLIDRDVCFQGPELLLGQWSHRVQGCWFEFTTMLRGATAT